MIRLFLRPVADRAPIAALALIVACGGSPEPSGSSGPAPEPASASAGSAGPGAGTSVLDGVFSEDQAMRGQDVFRSVCADCHETREFRGERFLLSWEGTSVGRFVERLMTTMPDGAPGSLPTHQYIDVTAYILELNGFPAGPAELDDRPEVLDAIRIERGGEDRP